ncbi:MAG: CO dehydrogenase/CO-methylating acetyl-CoA synthase complex subunit beta [Chloroflexi bacterium]|nr:MAG: CO dehydrogenase/CO-methylating acetyl-CoA synthase complex subunit beta [Chloroflexota bacterium]
MCRGLTVGQHVQKEVKVSAAEDTEVKIPPGREFQLPTDPDHLWDGLQDVGLGIRWVAEVKKADMQIELSGPKWEYKSYTILEVIEDPNQVRDGIVTLIGPDIHEVEPGTSAPSAWEIKVYGPGITQRHREYVERQMAMALHGIEGYMAFGSFQAPWMRISKAVVGRLTFAKLCQVVHAYVKTVVPQVEKMEFRWIVATPEVGGLDLILPLYKRGIERLKAQEQSVALEDEDVDIFYGCTICKSLAPNHVCAITPSQIPYCGILSYNGAQVTVELDPEGYIFPMPKGECRDPDLGSYTGVDEAVYERSNHQVKRVNIFSAIRYPTTNCGCFEGAAFYIPEVDGLGLAIRRYIGVTPLGIKFSRLAGMISGGSQNHGYKGISLRSMQSKTFLKGDGGWNRIVWMPADMKQEMAEYIPEEVYDKIATEQDTIDPGELREFLKQKGHPIVERFWKNGEPQPLNLPPPGGDWPDE